MSVPQLYHDLYDNTVYTQTREKIKSITGSEERTNQIMNTLEGMAIALCRDRNGSIALSYLGLLGNSPAVLQVGAQYAVFWLRRIAQHQAKEDKDDS